MTLQTRAKNYESEAQQKDKQIVETSAPVSIEKLVDIMPKIPKGVFKNTLHNPNAGATSNYSVVEDLSQTPCAVSALELLQSCPSQ